MKDILALFGIVALGCVIISVAAVIWEAIKELIEDLKWEYKYKHRFDKSPTAKCYCVDCKYHNNESGRCYRFHENSNRLTADNCFCCEAEPHKKGK